MPTDSPRLVDQLRSTLGKMEVALGAITEAIVWTDRVGEIQWCNGVFERLVNQQQTSLLGGELSKIFPLSQKSYTLSNDCHPAYLASRNRNNGAGIYEYKLEEGALRTLAISWSSIVLDDVDEVTAILAIRDITNQKKVEDDLHRSRLRLEELVEQKTYALRDSQNLYSHLFKSSNDGIIIHDITGNILEVNPRMMTLMGHSEGSLLSKKLPELHPYDEIETCKAALHTLTRSASYQFETVFKRKDGTIFPAEVSASLFDLDGHKLIQSMVRDISDRKIHEEKQRKATLALQQQIDREKLLKAITLRVRQSLDLNDVLTTTVQEVRTFFETDRVLIYRFQSDWSGEIVVESVENEAYSIIDLPIHDPCFGKNYASLYQEGRIGNVENIATAGLKPCYVEMMQELKVVSNLTVPILQGDNLWGLLFVHHCQGPRKWQASDVDLIKQLAIQVAIAVQQSELYQQVQLELLKRAQTEAELVASEASMRLLYDVTAKPNLSFSESIQELLKFGCEQFGMDFGLLSHVEGDRYTIISGHFPDGTNFQGVSCSLEQTYCNETLKAQKPLCIRSAGTSSWADHSCYQMFKLEAYLGSPVLVNGELYGTLVFCHRQPKQKTFKAFEKELLRLMAQWISCEIERQQSADELAQARDEALAATRTKSEFLATMSHEIRTPMNAVIGMTGILLDTALTHEQRDFVHTIRNAGDSLLTIINDILDFSKIESGQLDLEQHPFDIHTCIEEAFDLLATKATEKRLELAYQVSPSVPPKIIGDVTRLRQILVNLLGNAVKFTHKGEIVISVITRERGADGQILKNKPAKQHFSGFYEIVFSVKDTGIGIPKARMNRLFKAFSQVDSSTTRKYGGTGLGLVICKQLAEMMGGTMWVESEEGVGTTFHFSIIAEAISQAVPQTLEPQRQVLQGKRVLIVDDNTTNRKILDSQTVAWGMLTRLATSGAEALRWFEQGETFDIAILDMQMPEMDGLTLATEIHRLPDAKNLPLVMLTSIGRHELNQKIIDEHFVAFLNKPIKQSTLFNILIGVFNKSYIPIEKKILPSATIDHHMAETLPLRILLAEDNVVNQKLATQLLTRMGYRPDIAGNGLEAIEAIKRQIYDVVLMDVHMPEMDGIAATQTICQTWDKENRPHIIAMTANAMQGDREMCLNAGMDDYVSKPIRIDSLVKALRKCVSRKSDTPRPVSNEDKPAPELSILGVDQPAPKGLNSVNTDVNIDRATVDEAVVDDIDALVSIEPPASIEPPVSLEPLVGLDVPVDVDAPAKTPPPIEEVSVVSNTSRWHDKKILDTTALDSLMLIMGDQSSDFLQSLIDTYLSETPLQIKAMEDAIEQTDAHQLEHYAHTLKSSSASLGAMEFSNICQILERAGRSGTTQNCDAHMMDILDLHQRVTVALTQYCEQKILV